MFGDHIMVKRFVYYHHGLETIGGYVIHYSGEPGQKRNAAVQTSTMAEFLNGGKRETVAYSECLPPEETVAIAHSQLGKQDYNIFWKNCEHFARYCKTKEDRSEQVDDAVIKTGTSIVSGTSVAASITSVSAAGSAAGLSGSGIMSGLAAIGPAGAIGGLATLSAVPTAASNIAVSRVLRDDKKLCHSERAARKAGRCAAPIGTAAGAIGSVGAISALGTTVGLSAPGITSGLAAIGGFVGGGMATGTALTIAAPAVITLAAGFVCRPALILGNLPS